MSKTKKLIAAVVVTGALAGAGVGIAQASSGGVSPADRPQEPVSGQIERAPAPGTSATAVK